MKASIKFREEQKPLIRAKIPLTILGFPFQSGVVSGDSKELGLSLATSFEYGPSAKIAYRPNDSTNPFSLAFKTGIGRFGSRDPSPITMSAEFNLIGSHNPTFFVHFKPQFGDFSIKKFQSSDFGKGGSNGGLGSCSDDDSIEVVESPMMKNGVFSGEKAAAVVVPETATQLAAGILCGMLRGMEASARTALPVMRMAVVNFRWGIQFPAEEEATGARGARNSFQKLPMLVMNKISIEHVAEDKKRSGKEEPQVEARAKLSDDVAGTCLGVMRQLEMTQCENGMLRKALDELRHEFATGKFASVAAVGGGERAGSGGGGGGRGGEKVKEERDGKEDLKKAM